MAKPKPSPRLLARMFDRSATPVYAVNQDMVIVYANESCAHWVDVELEELISTTCVFSSQDLSGLQNKVQGLCPPPESLKRGDNDNCTPCPFVVSATDGQDRKSWRDAMMCPFVDADQTPIGVLVICGDQEYPNPELAIDSRGSTVTVDSEKLHTALAQIRTRTDRIHSLESLVGTSPFAVRLRRQVSTAIEANSDLLIFGSAGTGKEHLARTIHAERDRRKISGLIPVHCSIADQQLIQQNIKDILSTRNAPGRSAKTENQDWLLLLDVDRLGEAAQNELLGFFQIPDFSLRTIATSSVSIIELAENQKFSLDLAHHLSVMTIELVSLSKRKSDVPLLAQALIERDNVRRDRQLSGFSEVVMQQLIEFEWPENIDQLNRTIRIAAKNARGPQIVESDLPDEFCHGLRAQRIGTAEETRIELDQYLGEIEKELIVRALRQAKGNKTKAAKLLGISRPKLLRRLQFFNLEDPRGEVEENDGQLDSSAFEELK